MQFARELEVAERAALAAGAVVARHYAAETIAVETKSDDSPVTVADREANDAIERILRETFPLDAILSEETPDDRERMTNERVWIVDPLDGTRDFVARTGQFAVHIALAVDGEAVLGVVYQPVTGALYSGVRGQGAVVVRDGIRSPIHVSDRARKEDLRIGVSRLNATSVLGRVLETNELTTQAVPMGASSKHMALAAGELDAVICLGGGENEWDTCAPEVVIREAGGRLSDGEGRPFKYNQADTMHHRGSLASNGACHDSLLEILRPYLYDASVQ